MCASIVSCEELSTHSCGLYLRVPSFVGWVPSSILAEHWFDCQRPKILASLTI